MRKAILVVNFFCILVSLAGGEGLYAAVPAGEQAALWSELKDAKNNSGASKLDDWHVIEGISLIKKTDNVSNKAAALATVIKHNHGQNKFIDGDPQVLANLDEKARKKGLKERDLMKLGEHFGKHIEMISEEYENAKKGREKFLTLGVDFSRLIEKYIADNKGDIGWAMNSFASRRAYAAAIIMKKSPPFSYIADSITMGKPLILQQTGTDNFFVCVGFMSKGGIPYVIIADPDKIDFEEVSNADFILGQGDAARRAREKAKSVLDKQFGLAKRDRKFQLSGDLLKGVEITNWSQNAFVSYSIDFAVTQESIDKTFFSHVGGVRQ